MRPLIPRDPTPEQVRILHANTPGVVIVRGAAGSGKTTAALYRARKVLAGLVAERELSGDASPVRMLILTFNRTLAGYVEELAVQNTTGFVRATVEVQTFAKWVSERFGRYQVIDDREREAFLKARWAEVRGQSRIDADFIVNEVTFVLGRYGRRRLEEYMTANRTGRGSPSLQMAQRRVIREGVVAPYLALLNESGSIDWSDCAEMVLSSGFSLGYDGVIADEVQDFGVQRVRAIISQVRAGASLTFVIDSGQSIYPHVMYWDEAGIDLRQASVFELRNNYRNTRQIAQFAQPLLDGMQLTADGMLPNYELCRNTAPGRTPELLAGRFQAQLDAMLKELAAIPSDESVAILTLWGDPQRYVTTTLTDNHVPWVDIQRTREWPRGPEQVAVSTLHSAKGLEFDHVFVLGFDNRQLRHFDAEPDASAYLEQRRLLAMAVSRPRKSVFIGYHPDFRSPILDLLNPNSYILREVR